MHESTRRWTFAPGVLNKLIRGDSSGAGAPEWSKELWKDSRAGLGDVDGNGLFEFWGHNN